ncbi:hypothetical protein APX70_200264 [Pseudomonas syringae pv. maculicola]|uniref:Uncharacterized protein n=1 Tax=Pseudomonas syringae pv. maculicola TaxID=59511 RepID=A0A3M2YIQ1_PSEYM|nr:hypothetical protein APX70_200264 [Pseudomonas syringae pv. maculicola]
MSSSSCVRVTTCGELRISTSSRVRLIGEKGSWTPPRMMVCVPRSKHRSATSSTCRTSER